MSVFSAAYSSEYDTLYRDKDYAGECDLVERVLRAAGGPAGSMKLLDVGCGTGSHAIEFARRGHRVVGVDRSEPMLQQARRKAETIADAARRPEFVCADATDLRLATTGFDAAVMMFAVLSYLTRNEQLACALASIAGRLRPGGLFVCDFWWGPAVLTQRPGERVRTVALPTGKLIRAARTDLVLSDNVAEVHYALYHVPNVAGPAEESSETHRMRYFFGPELHLLFAAAGFELLRIARFPECDRPPGDDAWNAMAVARRA